MYRVIRSALLLMCGLLVAACSASDFTTPVTAFSDVTGTAATSFKSSRESIEKLATAKRFALVANGGNIGVDGDDCTPNGKHCRLVVIDKFGKKQPLASPLDNLQLLMDGLNAYTKGLVNIVKADTAGEVAKGTQAIKTNLSGLAQDADSLAKATNVKGVSFARASAFIAPVSDAANFAISKALEAEKVAALRQATSEMEEMFPALTKVFEAVNTAAMRHQRNEIDAAFRKARDEYRRTRSDSNRTAFVNAADAYNAALTSNPKNVFEALREAHGVLAQSLKSSNPSFTELFGLLERATEEANKLAEINKAFQKARASASTPS